jgi:hypothetical protein
MRTIIAGSRSITNRTIVARVVDLCDWQPTVVLSGAAAGVDRLGEDWAKANGLMVARYYADWSRHGNAAGVLRNRKMADNGEALIAIWDGTSPGTKSMIGEATKRRLRVFAVIYDQRADIVTPMTVPAMTETVE